MYKIHVLTGIRSGVTGRALAQTLRGLSREVSVTQGKTFSGAVDLLVRWGNSSGVDGSFIEQFNSAEAISSTSHKRKMHKSFISAGVPTPKYWDDVRDVPASAFPVVLRAPYHYKGQGFWLVNDLYSTPRVAKAAEAFALEVISIESEYRVFVYKGTIFEINKKMQEHSGGVLNSMIRNHHNGWVNRRGGFEVPNGLRPAAKLAAEAVGLDFGACDIYRDTTGNIGVFEINSAPGLVQRKLDKLAGKILADYVLGEEL